MTNKAPSKLHVERRRRVLGWLRAHKDYRPTTSDVANYADYFDPRGGYKRIYLGSGRYDRANRDLKAMERHGDVVPFEDPAGTRWAASNE